MSFVGLYALLRLNCCILTTYKFVLMRRLFFLLYLVCGSVLSLFAGGPPLIVAHRGGAGHGVENTLSCIERGVASGADIIEVDVRMTADGHVVVCHDRDIKRTTCGKGRIDRLSLADVRSFCVVDSEGLCTGETIPTLREVLGLVAGRCAVLIEVKGDVKGAEEAVLGDIVACDAVGWVSVQSFSDAVLGRFVELGAPFPLEKLLYFKVPLLPLLFDGSLRCFSYGKYAHVSSFNFHKSFFCRRVAKGVKSAGKGVKVWTYGVPSSKTINSEIDAVITDFPALWSNVLR